MEDTREAEKSEPAAAAAGSSDTVQEQPGGEEMKVEESTAGEKRERTATMVSPIAVTRPDRTKPRQAEVQAMIGAITELARNECEEPAEEEWSQAAEEPNEEEDDQLKEDEFKRFEDFNAFTAVDRSEAKTRPLSMTWVIEKRSGVKKARLCARPLGREPR